MGEFRLGSFFLNCKCRDLKTVTLRPDGIIVKMVMTWFTWRQFYPLFAWMSRPLCDLHFDYKPRGVFFGGGEGMENVIEVCHSLRHHINNDESFLVSISTIHGGEVTKKVFLAWPHPKANLVKVENWRPFYEALFLVHFNSWILYLFSCSSFPSLFLPYPSLNVGISFAPFLLWNIVVISCVSTQLLHLSFF